MIARNRPSVAALNKTVPAQEFLNRELSLLAFNERVLAQAEDASWPLLERLRFLCISSSNLDEFFEVRVAGLREQLRLQPKHADVDGLPADRTLALVSARAHRLVDHQYRVLNETLLPLLAREGIVVHLAARWNEAIAAWAREYFRQDVLPVLTPIGLDPAHPFPRVLNKSLNFAVELGGRDAFGRKSGVAIVQAPRALPRLIRLPADLSTEPYGIVLLTTIMQAHVAELFSGMEIHGCHAFRVTRNSDLFVDDEEITNLRVALQGELPQRHYGDAVRLEIAHDCSERIAQLLRREFALDEAESPHASRRDGGPALAAPSGASVEILPSHDPVNVPEETYLRLTRRISSNVLIRWDGPAGSGLGPGRPPP